MKTVRSLLLVTGSVLLAVAPDGVVAWPTPCMIAIQYYAHAKADLYSCLMISGEADHCVNEISALAMATDMVESACYMTE